MFSPSGRPPKKRDTEWPSPNNPTPGCAQRIDRILQGRDLSPLPILDHAGGLCPVGLEARPETPMPPADGSCVVSSRNEEKIDALPIIDDE